jgi:hypothetical protein
MIFIISMNPDSVAGFADIELYPSGIVKLTPANVNKPNTIIQNIIMNENIVVLSENIHFTHRRLIR